MNKAAPLQARIDVAADGRVTAAYSELPEQPLPVPVQLRAVPVDYFDVSQLSAFWRGDLWLLSA